MCNTVRFSQDTFHAAIRLPALIDFPVKNLHKLFSIMLWDERENERAIQDTEQYLERAVSDSKQAWHEASARYQEEWRLIEKPAGRRTKKDMERDAAIRAHNDALIRAVKKAKRQYERWVKIQALWNDTKHKMKIEN